MIPETDFDSPWKEAVERYLRECLALVLPQAHAEIDWSRDFVFRDTELQQLAPESAAGRRVVDKLVQVWLLDGVEAWVLIHVEVQNQEEREFARRMYAYHSRLVAHAGRPVVSVAILGDDRATWRPDPYRTALWGCAVSFEFPVIKLLAYRARWDELEASTNPFAGVIMAHLRAMETRQDALRRRVETLALVRWLLTREYSREDAHTLFRFIDWLMVLPREMSERFWREVHAYEEEARMPYITSIEQIGIEKGLEQGLQQGRTEGRTEGLLIGLEQLLGVRFGEAGRLAFEEMRGLQDPALIEAIVKAAGTASSLDEVRAISRPNT